MVLITEIPAEETDSPILYGPNKDEIFFDLSRKSLINFPKYLLNSCQHIKQLYLEGNSLAELPDEFYSHLQHLEYLDLRCNKLKTISKDICMLKNLEILLLESNRLEKLPDELGLLENLKGLQLTNNPLSYPPTSIIVQGSFVILQFLKKAAIAKETPQEEKKMPIQRVEKTAIKKHPKVHWKCSRKVNPFDIKKRNTKIPTMKDILDRTLRDISLRRLRFIFERQEKILQKRRDHEVMKTWRWKYNQLPKVKPEGKCVSTVPFGNDNDDENAIKVQRKLMKKGLNFKEIWPRNREHLNRAMAEVTETMAQLELDDQSKAFDVRDRQSLAKYMTKVDQLQDRLRLLRLINSHH